MAVAEVCDFIWPAVAKQIKPSENWALKDAVSGQIIGKSGGRWERMRAEPAILTDAGSGRIIAKGREETRRVERETRTLKELGVRPGTRLETVIILDPERKGAAAGEREQ